MIKEKKKKKKKVITFKEELVGYAKTAGIAFIAGAVFTILLSFHSRSEMIKNLYANKNDKLKLEAQVARQIVAHSDLTNALVTKNFVVCMQVGNLYEAAGDYNKAEYAYHLAVQKAPNGNFSAHLKLALVLIAQDKMDDAEDIIQSVPDFNSLSLIRFKTRANIVLGDKYYSKSMFLKAADAYEKANYYYLRLTKRDKVVHASILKRLVQAYLDTASVIVKNGYNSDAVRFLKKALKYDPDNLQIQYRLAIVYADLDPIVSIDYFEPLIEKIPQDIDYETYGKVLMKAANIMDIQGNSIQAKYYRYKIHSLDLYVNKKVVYKDDLEVFINSFNAKKIFFTYKVKGKVVIKNVSAQDIKKMYAEFVFRKDDKQKESLITQCATKRKPLYSNGGESEVLEFQLGKNIFTKRELKNYYVDVYVYKDPKFKTKIASYKVPLH